MKIKSILFVSAVLSVSLICIGIMNIHYDRLSRYPYQDEEARALIDQYFSDEEIQYLIEYSIAPSTFIDYISCEGFNLYHVSDYNHVRSSVWYLMPEDIVYVVELAKDQMSVEVLCDRLLNYDSMAVIHYLTYGDIYNQDSVLIDNPMDLEAVLDDGRTIGTRTLFDRAILVSMPSSSDAPITISKELVEPVKAMCAAIETELDNHKTCGGLIADAGYVSYDEQVTLFEEALTLYGDDVLLYADYPGHSDHQLGFSLDLSVKGFKQENFNKSAQYEWLKENAHRFGFVESYTADKEDISNKKARPWQWRYVGYELAAEMYFNHLSLKEAVSWEK